MWRAPLVFLGLLLVAWLEFEFYPGHTYLRGASQLYLPILEHLDSPGYLTRDLVATHPHVAFTVYDEVTLFLHNTAKLAFQKALLIEQVVFRLAGLFGVFLLARACGMRRWPAVGVAALINLGTFLPGPDLWLVELEPVPRAFAFGLILLAMGLLATGKPLLAGLFGGLALAFDPATAAPFWLVLLTAFVFDRHLRTLLRPAVPILLIFVLLLANLAQLQPGIPDSQPLSARFSEEIAHILRFRSPDLWVSLWPSWLLHLYLAAFVLVVWAATRVWAMLNRPMRWMFVGLPLVGILAIPVSSLTVEHLHWAAALRMQPMQTLVYTVLFLWLSAMVAFVRAWRHRAFREAALWLIMGLLLPVCGVRSLSDRAMDPAVSELAAWAENSTWGSSMFLFPAAGRDLYPGAFRAGSRRALWVDWPSGRQINYDVALAPEWWQRWSSTMQGPLSGDHLQRMLALPIDYFAFGRDSLVQAVSGGESRIVHPVFSNRAFHVYEASTLRTVPGRLILQISPAR